MLFETIYKLASMIVIFRLLNGIEFHNAVHRGSEQREDREQRSLSSEVADGVHQDLWGR